MVESKSIYRPFDEPPYDLGRLACVINAMIEVLNLPLEKLKECTLTSVANAIKIIANDNYLASSEGFMAIMVQEIIDALSLDRESYEKIMSLCEEKYNHLNKTNLLT